MLQLNRCTCKISENQNFPSNPQPVVCTKLSVLILCECDVSTYWSVKAITFDSNVKHLHLLSTWQSNTIFSK